MNRIREIRVRSLCRSAHLLAPVIAICSTTLPQWSSSGTTHCISQEVGELGAQPERETDDRCRASCMDWYGNARPLFVRGRVIALLGYELVEGTLDDGRMRESRRVSDAPGNLTASRAEQGEPPSKK
jgi:hypothetical protein